MSQQPQTVASQPYPDGVGGEGAREGEASSTDCSELSGHPESSSVSGAEETVQGGDLEDRATQVDDERLEDCQKVPNGVTTRDAEVSAQGDLFPLDIPVKRIEDKDVNTDAETKEVSTQSPPEMAVQVNEPVTPPPSPVTPSRHTHVPEMPVEKAVIESNREEVQQKAEDEKEKHLQKDETPRQKRRNGGRGKNNKQPSQPAKPAAAVEKVPEPEPVHVYIEKTEALEPLHSFPTPTQLESKTEPIITAEEIIETIPAPIEPLPRERTPVEEKKTEIEVMSVAPEPTSDFPESKEILQKPSPIILAEQRAEPPKTLELDTFTFKPEPYKHPMLQSSKVEKKEEPILGADSIVPEVNGVRTKAEEAEEKKIAEEFSPSRHLEDMPRKKTRLKEPPEREKTPPLSNNEADEKGPEQEVRNAPALDEQRNEDEIDNKPHGPEDQPAEVAQPSEPGEESEVPSETLTEVVSKWLEENSDALPDSTEEMKEKTEERGEGEKVEDENSTGSKNGVSNPFPVPSNRLTEEMTLSACKSVNAEERVCVSNASANVISRDGSEKRVANGKIGKFDEGQDDYNDQGGRKLEDSDDSCEWEPMTVEPPKKTFTDLETWKRLRSGLSGSSEAIRSLGSYRGTDDEDEEEGRKVMMSMCDPTSSVAKYYCLGGRETKSGSPEEVISPPQIPVQTDSGVQSDAEDELIPTGEEAVEENATKGRSHKSVGLGKTAAFVVRQIGTTESVKGPFPCGICCIIQ